MSTSTNRPPDLDGFTFVESIGKGGFAEVFLYQQTMPSMRVAIKVLRESAEGEGRELFHAEANVMAQLSGHPSIVPIYGAGVSPDGRPYLVMEYCPPPSLAGRFRAERIEVPEALETMIKISSAVETAHRAGILHRDVKPHNILISSFGAPMLTDFGIAGTTTDTESAAYGLSVPWSPPEAFGESMSVDPRSDVFSLAATLYSLLAGRSPFEVVGASNDNATLMSRIERQPLTRIARADVPDALQSLLERAMSKDVGARHPSAMAFARSLQDVQAQLHLGQTRIDVLDASPAATPVQDTEHRTHVRPVQIIVPEDEAGTRLRPIIVPQAARQVRSAPAVDDRTALRAPKSPRAEPVPDTMARGGSAPADHTDGSHFLRAPEPTPRKGSAGDQTRGRSKPPVAVLAGAALAVLVLGGIFVATALGGGPEARDAAIDPVSEAPQANDVLGDTPTPPREIKHRAGPNGVTFTWSPPEESSGVSYAVSTGPGPDELSAPNVTSATSVTVKAEPGEIACLEIRALRGSAASPKVSKCEVNR